MSSPAHLQPRPKRSRWIFLPILLLAVVGVVVGLIVSSGGGSPKPGAVSTTTVAKNGGSGSTTATPTSGTTPTTGTAPATTTGAGTTSSTSSVTSPTTTTPSSTPTTMVTVTQVTLVYTVQPGDNLWTIATWFRLHGYQGLYAWNMAEIGTNPNLILPGYTLVCPLPANDVAALHLPASVMSHIVIKNTA